MDLLLLIVTCAINLILGLVVFTRDTSKVYARIFLMLSVSISLWIIFNYLTNHYLGSNMLVSISNYLAFLFGYLALVFAMLFSYYFPVRRKPADGETIALYALVITTSVLCLTPLISGGVIITDGVVSFTAGPLAALYLVSSAIVMAVVGRNLIKLPKVSTFKIRQQARLILVAFVTSALLGLTFNLVIPILSNNNWDTTRVGPISTVFLVGIIAYTIVKHRLFDIRTAIVRTAAYGLAVATLTGVYSLVFLVGLTNISGFEKIPVTQQITLLALAFMGGLSLPQLVKFFDRQTSKIFFRDSYDYRAALQSMNDTFSAAVSLDQLLKDSSHELKHLLGSEFVAVTLTDNDKNKQILGYSSLGKSHHGVLPERTQEFMLSKNIKFVSTDDQSSESKLLSELWKTKTSVIVSLSVAGTVIGFMVLGYKQNGTSYSPRDINLLKTLSAEFAIAVQNMLRFKEITEFNSVLQGRINDATSQLRSTNRKLQELDKSKDEFISMASHQLRTPLTSVKGYISMVLEGDMGKISTQQRQVLEQAYDSSQRMVFLIGDFLNVSRIQTGKFELEKSTINFTHLVDEEVEQLKETARMHNMTLVYDKPDTEHFAVGDENKLRQVMMNFIDNAIFYSPKNSTITVRLYREASGLVFKVIDQGIGVPKEAQAKLFTKFFRAANARQQRPDGTGIGLYMAKKVIVAHEGTIIFETKEGVGSTFGFRLPLKKDLQQTGNDQGTTT